MKGQKKWNNFLDFFLASWKIDVDVNTPICRSLIHIFVLYWETDNLVSDTNFIMTQTIFIGTHTKP